MFEDSLKNNQGLQNDCVPNTLVSPHKAYNRYSLQPLFRNQNFTSRQKFSSYDNSNPHIQPSNKRSRSITPNNRNTAFQNSQNPKYHSCSITLRRNKSTGNFQNCPRSSTSQPAVKQILITSKKISSCFFR